jgi:hypothetical protein
VYGQLKRDVLMCTGKINGQIQVVKFKYDRRRS